MIKSRMIFEIFVTAHQDTFCDQFFNFKGLFRSSHFHRWAISSRYYVCPSNYHNLDLVFYHLIVQSRTKIVLLPGGTGPEKYNATLSWSRRT